jgi:hypothetical protein
VLRKNRKEKNGWKFEKRKQRKGGENEHTEASRFKFIMNSFRAPNFNTVLFLESLPLRHLCENKGRFPPPATLLGTSENYL